MFKQFNKFYSPDNSSTGIIDSPSGSGKESIIDFLSEDDDKPEIIELDDDSKTKEKKEKTEPAESEDTEEPEESDEVDELDELEDELTPPTDEQLELVTPVRRKEILAKYPKLFKEFPYLEKAYYREQQYTEILPTINDAKEAAESHQTLANVEKDLMDGSTERLLLAAKNSNPTAFNKIVDNYLITLGKVDEKAYHHVIGNTISHTIRAMVTEARRSNNDVLQNAAAILNQFVFGSSEYVPPKTLTVEEKVDPRLDEITKRERALVTQKFDSANGELHTRVNNQFKSTIEAYIDPKQSMTEYVRRNASREALESLENAINSDTRFRALIDKLWEHAIKNDMRKDAIEKIRSAFLSKGKTLLPSVIKKARNEALKGMGKRVVEDPSDDDESESKPTKKTESKNKDTSHPRKSSDNKRNPSEGMSSLEYLMSDD
jgi:hypothetical protein